MVWQQCSKRLDLSGKKSVKHLGSSFFQTRLNIQDVPMMPMGGMVAPAAAEVEVNVFSLQYTICEKRSNNSQLKATEIKKQF